MAGNDFSAVASPSRRLFVQGIAAASAVASTGQSAAPLLLPKCQCFPAPSFSLRSGRCP